MNSPVFESTPSTPLLSSTSTTTSSGEDDYDNTPVIDSSRIPFKDPKFRLSGPQSCGYSDRSLAVLSGHVGSVSCLALCGEFILSASQGKDIIVWQQPDLRKFAKFGQGDGSVKALLTVGNKVFTAHQDSRIRVWKVSRSSENMFKLVSTMPTTKDYLGKFMKQRNYVQTRRNHKRLWIEHADSISCLAFSKGLIYSGSWDKTLKVWRVSDLKCLESIRAHDDAINGLVENKGLVYSASADGKIKVWLNNETTSTTTTTTTTRITTTTTHGLKGVLEGHKDVSLNSVVVSPNGDVVYGGGSDGYVMIWAVNSCGSWKLVGEVRAHKMAVLCLSLVGEFVFSGSADKSIGVWRREGVGVVSVGVLMGHEGPVKCLQASPSSVGGGFLVYSGGLDRSLRVWWVPKENSVQRKHESLLYA